MTNSQLRKALALERIAQLPPLDVTDDDTTKQDYKDWQAEREYERATLDLYEPIHRTSDYL